ncbi:AAA family ATPase [Chloroflexota bacterium]
MNHRIHIFGASGSGTTTLGRCLSLNLGLPHFDSDDYFWAESDIPYSRQREEIERQELLRSDLQERSDWVLSGSLCGWGDFTIPMFTTAIFLWIPEEIRIGRLKKRETERYGVEALQPGGWFHDNSEAFIAWASRYDSGGLEVRSRILHEQWMDELPCRVIRIEETLSTEELVAKVENQLIPG